MKMGVCGWCKKVFKKPHNKVKYCCEYCRIEAKREQSRRSSHRYYHKNKHRLSEKQRFGLGSGELGAHRHEDFMKESKVIANEYRRIGLLKTWK